MEKKYFVENEGNLRYDQFIYREDYLKDLKLTNKEIKKKLELRWEKRKKIYDKRTQLLKALTRNDQVLVIMADATKKKENSKIAFFVV